MRRIAFMLAAPVGAFVLTVVITTIALWLFGSDPFEAYGDMLSHASKLETIVDQSLRKDKAARYASAAALAQDVDRFLTGLRWDAVRRLALSLEFVHDQREGVADSRSLAFQLGFRFDARVGD